MKKIFVMILLFSLFGCTPQKRLQRLLKHHPELLQKDTVTVKDTFVINRTQFDTIVNAHFDTINIEKERVKIQLIKKDSLIYINAVTPGDTIVIEKKIFVDKIIYPTEKPTTSIRSKILNSFLATIVIMFLSLLILIKVTK